MMVPVPLKDFLKLHTLVGEVSAILGRVVGDGEPHPVASVIDPDTGREIPGNAAENPEPHPVDPEDDPEVEFEEVGLGTPT